MGGGKATMFIVIATDVLRFQVQCREPAKDKQASKHITVHHNTKIFFFFYLSFDRLCFDLVLSNHTFLKRVMTTDIII